MYHFGEIPMLRALIPFCLGIVLQIFFNLPVESIITAVAFSFIVSILYTYVKQFYRSYKYRWAFGPFIFITIVGVGALLVNVYSQNKRPLYFGNNIHQSTGYVIRLTEPWHEKEKTLKAVGEIKAININNMLTPATGKVMLHFQKNDTAYKLNYGNIIYTTAKPTPISEPQNPGEFNYKRFLGFHGIYHQFYFSEKNWAKTPSSETSWLWQTAFDLRTRFIAQIKNQMPTANEFAVCSALLIGFEDYLDQELIDAYSSSGALHVLSVSGLHVGIIYVFLGWILSFMDKHKWSFAIKNIFLILLIWFYALLAGLAPSILRSAVMITMLIIGTWADKQSYMLNTTLASAFLLLNTNPFMITEVGFQLSYLAVFGIVYLHQKFSNTIQLHNKLLNAVWQLTSVSLCAQLMTFPLGLLYFHQFPNLFLVSNILVIPISTLLMYASIAATVFTAIPLVSTFFWKVSYGLTLAMNWIVNKVDQLSFAIIQGISITIWETWLIYLIIAMALWFLLYKKRLAFFLFLILLNGFTAYQLYQNYFLSQQQKLIVYSVKNKTAIDLISGTSHIFIADDSLYNNKSKIRFHIQHNWFDLGIQKTQHINFSQSDDDSTLQSLQNGFTHFNNKIIYTPTAWLPKTTPAQKIKVDYLIISSRFKNKIEKLIAIFSPQKIILDSSIASYKLAKMETTLKQMNLSYYSVPKQGAFIEQF